MGVLINKAPTILTILHKLVGGLIMTTLDIRNTEYLIGRLFKECESNGYLGVEYDNLDTSDVSHTEALFHKIMIELNVLYGSGDEYVRDMHNEEAPFKSTRGLTKHMIKLGKFVHKYAKLYLPKTTADEFIEEVGNYIKW
ncbi:hypothetical protein LIS04_177 [Listeria phage LIS04]|nr:hypothetical protein LIS04_177 [Listeria phage LIS04]